MDADKQKRLDSAGWRIGSPADILELTEAEFRFIESKLSLADAFKKRRQAYGTQKEVAALLGSSQSRVAKLGAGDPSVSIDLLVRGLLALGATRRQVGSALSARIAAKGREGSRKS